MMNFKILAILILLLSSYVHAESIRCLKLTMTTGKQTGTDLYLTHINTTPENFQKRLVKIKTDYNNPTVEMMEGVDSHEACLQKNRDAAKAGKGIKI